MNLLSQFQHFKLHVLIHFQNFDHFQTFDIRENNFVLTVKFSSLIFELANGNSVVTKKQMHFFQREKKLDNVGEKRMHPISLKLFFLLFLDFCFSGHRW